MEERLRTNRTGIAAGILGAVALLVVIAIVFDLGPFDEDELSVPEFLSQADEICSKAHDEFLDIQKSAPRTADEAESISQALVEVAEEEAESIRALAEPATVTEPLNRYLTARERGIEILRTGIEAAKDEDPDAYEKAQAKLARSQPDRRRAAQEIGFNECSEPLVNSEELKRQGEQAGSG